MRQHKRSLPFLLLSLLLFAALVGLLFFLPPTVYLTTVPFSFTTLYLFFPLVFLFLFFSSAYFLKNKTQGLLIALFVITYLLFRLNNLTHPFFFFLLATLFVALGFLFNYRK